MDEPENASKSKEIVIGAACLNDTGMPDNEKTRSKSNTKEAEAYLLEDIKVKEEQLKDKPKGN